MLLRFYFSLTNAANLRPHCFSMFFIHMSTAALSALARALLNLCMLLADFTFPVCGRKSFSERGLHIFSYLSRLEKANPHIAVILCTGVNCFTGCIPLTCLFKEKLTETCRASLLLKLLVGITDILFSLLNEALTIAAVKDYDVK